MTYRSDDYSKLDRNHTRARSMLDHVDQARDFNRLKYVEKISVVATDREGYKIEISASGNLKDAIAAAGASFCIESAKAIQTDPEPVDFEKAAKT